MFGDGQIDDLVLVDQSPIGRSPRSKPVTYIKAFDEIRNVFAETLEARTRNYSASHFSFNVDGGRCSTCEGDGYLQIDMQFMADVYMKCPECNGQRYRPEILKVQYRGRNIAEVLDMTAREAFTFFRGCNKVQVRMKRLIDVGLDYLRLGQPANTLSGGEAQRLKLAGYMSAAKRSRTLFILDEPTTGLHFADVVQLLDCFEALLAVGHSLIVVEHNLQMMKAADWIIDLGPGAADEGGPNRFTRNAGIHRPPGTNGDRAISCRSAGPPNAGAAGVTQDCGDDRTAPARQLELFFGDASDAVARVYARLPCDETTTGSQLTGELIGPECRFAQTLSARIPFQDRGPGESLLAEAVVPDPCFWTPELPMLYKARIERKGPEVVGQGAGIEKHEVVVTGRCGAGKFYDR